MTSGLFVKDPEIPKLLNNFRVGKFEKKIVVPSNVTENCFEGSSSERTLELGRTMGAFIEHPLPENFSGVVIVNEMSLVV